MRENKNNLCHSSLSLRWDRGYTDRCLIVGASASGKSTLAEQLIGVAAKTYPELCVLIIDSKPRFRAQFLLSGSSASSIYSSWDHGFCIPNSYLCNLSIPDFGIPACFASGGRIFIAQGDDVAEHIRLLECVGWFYKTARASFPRLVFVDEVMDFFDISGRPLNKNWSLLKVARAGREKGIGLVTAAQRPLGIPRQLVQEITKLYLFRLGSKPDIKHLSDVSGIDVAGLVPSMNHVFRYLNYNHSESSLYRLSL